ncbi:glutamate receptor 2.8 [Amborella trichopoda]|uniref:glutamate receptor 2.8 n=1 Tax=Amborella trichopoda TaxID=13333 RepID=UPI0005D369B2|nr:glutamate receptor 2.8 [Amborella trichopoda]|eukprot:XP_006845552.2 glutamate receptor 2.8 [Amborella trichopoda]
MAKSFLLSLLLLCLCFCVATGRAQSSSVNVGVVLAMDTWIGRVGNMCISMALQDFYKEHPNYTTTLLLSTRDSGGNVVQAASAVVDLMKNLGVQAIIGPQSSAEAKFTVDLANISHVPLLSFSATSPSLSSVDTRYFVRAALNDSAQAKPIAALFKAYGWRQAVAIYEDTEYGAGFIPYLNDALLEVGSHLQHRTVLPASASNELINGELYKLMTMQTRIFIVHTTSPLASRLFLQVQQLGMMSKEYAWIITDGLSAFLDSTDPSVIASMQGVLGVKVYIEKTKRLADFTTRWKLFYRGEYPNEIEIPDLNVFGLRAYDATWALALAVEKSGTRAVRFPHPIVGKVNSTDLSTLGISPVGSRLLNAVLDTDFTGLTGNIRFVNGELQVSTFQIINIIGQGIREIGFWSPIYGLSSNLNQEILNKKNGYSADVADLKPVIWPGESTVVPKGWVIPTSGVKLKIGVPVRYGFKEFVNVERDPGDNRLRVTGFSIDVFNAVLEVLPYALPYEFVPFENSEGIMAGTYNDLVNQVFLGKYDAVVGDVTILANRSNHVDFTLPYTESGVTMIVPTEKVRKSSALVFLKPLTLELWVTTACFFFFMAFVIWFLEHRINEDFRGPPIEQVGRALYFSFSMLVFAHRDQIKNNLSRFVIILWLFVLLILSNNYTANLASILTVERSEPTITDVQKLINNGDYVGYQRNSYVKDLLLKLGFSESKLKACGTIDEYANALLMGSSGGGVAAIFDEIPKIKLFLAYYHHRFTMAGPTFRTAGYGFVLPKNSLLLSDFSAAVLNVTEGDKMEAIERAWFGKNIIQPVSSPATTSTGLTLDCFWVLFLIVGIASIGALIWFSICLWIKNHNRFGVDEQGLWQQMNGMGRVFNERDHPSQTFSQRKRVKEVELNRDVAVANMESPLSITEATTPTRSSSASEEDASAIVPLTPLDHDDHSAPTPGRDTP